MSPSIRLALLTFGCGIVVGVVGGKWIPSSQATSAATSSLATAPPLRSSTAPLASTSDSAPKLRGAAPDEPETSTASTDEDPKTPAARAAQARKSLDDLLATVGELPENERGPAVMDFIYQMRALGPVGVQTIRDFLQRGEDVKLTNNIHLSGGRFANPPTFRIAMLDALNDMKDPAVAEISLDVLRSTPSLMEATLAIRNLEKRSPETYRTEALKTVRELLNGQPEDSTSPWMRTMLGCELLRHFKAPELLPAVEATLMQGSGSLHEYVQVLPELNEADRIAATQRLLTDPKLSKYLADQSFVVNQLDWTESSTRQGILTLFAKQMNAKEQDNFLANFAQDNMYFSRNLLGGSSRPNRFGDEQRRARQEAKLEFLQQLAPHATTPVLQQRVSDARTQLQSSLKRK